MATQQQQPPTQIFELERISKDSMNDQKVSILKIKQIGPEPQIIFNKNIGKPGIVQTEVLPSIQPSAEKLSTDSLISTDIPPVTSTHPTKTATQSFLIADASKSTTSHISTASSPPKLVPISTCNIKKLNAEIQAACTIKKELLRSFKLNAAVPQQHKMEHTFHNAVQILEKHESIANSDIPFVMTSFTSNAVSSAGTLSSMSVRIPSSTIITTNKPNHQNKSLLLQNNLQAQKPQPQFILPKTTSTNTELIQLRASPIVTMTSTIKPILRTLSSVNHMTQTCQQITTSTSSNPEMIVISHNKIAQPSSSTIGSPIHVDNFLKTKLHESINVTTSQSIQPQRNVVPSSSTIPNSTISLQISNGRLSNPNGPIKILSSVSKCNSISDLDSIGGIQQSKFRLTTNRQLMTNEVTLLRVNKSESATPQIRQPQHSLTKLSISNKNVLMIEQKPVVLQRTNIMNIMNDHTRIDQRFRRLLSSPRLHKRSKSFTTKFQEDTVRSKRVQRLSESGIEDGKNFIKSEAQLESLDENTIKSDFNKNMTENRSTNDNPLLDSEKSIEDLINANSIKKNRFKGNSTSLTSTTATTAQQQQSIQDKPQISAREFNILLCDEKLDNSSENTTSSCDSLSKPMSVPLFKMDSEITAPLVLQQNIVYRPIVANPARLIKKIIEENRIGVNANRTASNESKFGSVSAKQTLLKDAYRRALKMKPKQFSLMRGTSINDEQVINDPANLIQWNDGIGYLKESHLHFQFNEFGLIEILGDEDFARLQGGANNRSYDEPLQKRKSDLPLVLDRKHIKNSTEIDLDIIYNCSGCKVKGLAQDFIAPEFCSISCFKNVKKIKQLQSNVEKPLVYESDTPRKYLSNRFKRMPSKLSRNSWFSNDDSTENNDEEFRPAADNCNELQSLFSWDAYLRDTYGVAAPLNLFINPYPSSPNEFAVGMKLEAIDPENASLFCVCSVVEIRGYRLRLHFDGFSSAYDFWVNADSLEIFPPGWCRKTNRLLQLPPAEDKMFEWNDYLQRTNCIAAPRSLFTHLNSSSLHKNPFERGMRLEADDIKNSGKICVATITDVLDDRILIHFDEWDHKYDYWVEITSPNIHPINWHKANNMTLIPPFDTNNDFSWNEYLERINGVAVPEILFCTRQPFKFRPGLKLEVVDQKNQSLIRPATILDTKEYALKVLFDGWPSIYAFWIVDDSVDIHPVYWSQKTNHPIEFPPGFGYIDSTSRCGIIGCRGLSNAKHACQTSHNCLDECPYEIKNWTNSTKKLDRFKSKPILHKYSRLQRVRCESGSSNSDDSVLNRKRSNPQQLISNHYDNFVPKKLRRFSNDDLAADKKHFSLDFEELPKQNEQMVEIHENDSRRLEVSKTFLTDYGPRLRQAQELWTKHCKMLESNFDDKHQILEKNPAEWSVKEAASYIGQLPNFTDVALKIEEEELDGSALLSLTQEDLMNCLDVKLGPAIKMYNCIIALREHIYVNFVKN